MEQKIDLNDVIESLSSQNQSLSISNAYNHAIIKSKDAEIKELKAELEQLRKEHIKQMDEESPAE